MEEPVVLRDGVVRVVGGARGNPNLLTRQTMPGHGAGQIRRRIGLCTVVIVGNIVRGIGSHGGRGPGQG